MPEEIVPGSTKGIVLQNHVFHFKTTETNILKESPVKHLEK